MLSCLVLSLICVVLCCVGVVLCFVVLCCIVLCCVGFMLDWIVSCCVVLCCVKSDSFFFLKGNYGLKRFLRDGYKSVLEDKERRFYEQRELEVSRVLKAICQLFCHKNKREKMKEEGHVRCYLSNNKVAAQGDG